MKLMILAEFGSTAAVEISVFHRLLAGNGTKPLRLAPWPKLIPLQLPACDNPALGNPKAMESPMAGQILRILGMCLLSDRAAEQRDEALMCVFLEATRVSYSERLSGFRFQVSDLGHLLLSKNAHSATGARTMAC
jgi:hypothetical protein